MVSQGIQLMFVKSGERRWHSIDAAPHPMHRLWKVLFMYAHFCIPVVLESKPATHSQRHKVKLPLLKCFIYNFVLCSCCVFGSFHFLLVKFSDMRSYVNMIPNDDPNVIPSLSPLQVFSSSFETPCIGMIDI